MEFGRSEIAKYSRVEKSITSRESYASNESRQVENNLKRRNAYSTMDPDKKRKMLDVRNGKRRAKIKEAQSLQIRVVNAARRFQYEPPGFCCSSGQVVLVSNEMPSLLKQLFCENDEVSRQ
nr:uncharacterized protein LOC109173038 [Ipomoea batatas]